MIADLNMQNNRIFNLPSPSWNNQPTTKSFVDNEILKLRVKPNHYNNEFKYLMANKLQWTDLLGDSFSISKIDNLYPHEGNYRQYNHKLLFTTIEKDQKGG